MFPRQDNKVKVILGVCAVGNQEDKCCVGGGGGRGGGDEDICRRRIREKYRENAKKGMKGRLDHQSQRDVSVLRGSIHDHESLSPHLAQTH